VKIRAFLGFFVFLLGLLFISAQPASAQAGYYRDISLNWNGTNLIPNVGAIITVCASTATTVPCTPTVSIYKDVGMSIPESNPITVTNTDGSWSFYAPTGQYVYTVIGTGLFAQGLILINVFDAATSGGGGNVDSVTASAPLASSGGANPNIAVIEPFAVTGLSVSGTSNLTGTSNLNILNTSGLYTATGNIVANGGINLPFVATSVCNLCFNSSGAATTFNTGFGVVTGATDLFGFVNGTAILDFNASGLILPYTAVSPYNTLLFNNSSAVADAGFRHDSTTYQLDFYAPGHAGSAIFNVNGSIAASSGILSSTGVTQNYNVFPETTAPSAVSGQDILYGDSSSHCIKASLNGGGFNCIPLGVQNVPNGGTGLTAITAHYIPVGNGTSALNLIAPSTSGYCLTSNGASSDPTFQLCSGAASTALSGITAAGAGNTIGNGDYNQRWNFDLTTNSGTAFYFGESGASSATTASLLRASTLSTSTLYPFQTDNAGNGIRLSALGVLGKIGTGSIDFAALSDFPTSCSNKAVIGLTNATTFNCQTITSSYVDTSVAVTGADINTSSQVTVTHLASALPIAQGGTAQTTGPIKRLYIQFAGSNAGIAGPGWDLPVSNAMSSASKTDGTHGTVQGILQAADGNIAYATFLIPSDWASFSAAKISFTTSDTTNGHTIIFNVATACTDPNSGAADTPAFNTANAFTTTTIGMSAVANALYSTATTGNLTGTGCGAGYILHLKFTRATDTATDTAVALTGGMIVQYVGAFN
jgi:hypothetical protein